MTTDVLIIGGGAIGLSIAFHLAGIAPTLRITLVESGNSGIGNPGQASFAAAGMLAPLAEAHRDGPLVRLGLTGLDAYPAFVDSVRAAASNDGDPLFQVSGPGMLRIAVTESEANRLRDDYCWQRDTFGLDIQFLDGSEARRLEPGLSHRIEAAILSPAERQVDPRRLTHSLRAACRRRGVCILAGKRVISARRSGDGYTAKLSNNIIDCGSLILAAGAWSRQLARTLDVNVPISPVRGQIFALEPPANTAGPLHHTVYGTDAYIVPRPGGRIIIGATEEPDAGFCATTVDGDIERLRNSAAMYLPGLATSPLDGSPWAGLRPASPDGLPILGSPHNHPNLRIATGHFRNGILLSPITGEIIAYGIVNVGKHLLLAPEFSPDRFNTR